MIRNSGAIACVTSILVPIAAEAAQSSQCRGFMQEAATLSYCRRNAYPASGPPGYIEAPCCRSLGILEVSLRE